MPGVKILLVEGRDDKYVIRNLYKNPNNLRVKPIGSVEKLLENIPVELKMASEEESVIGVIVDADDDPKARWQSLYDRFTRAGYHDVPNHPDPKGMVVDSQVEPILPKAGAWIMPDNESTGTLEDFLYFLVPEADRLYDHACKSVDSIPTTDRLFTYNDKPKAIMHTWLAWQKEPGRPYGTAIQAGFLDSNVPQANALVSWLERLFGEPEATP